GARGGRGHGVFGDRAEVVGGGDLVVANRSRVFPARLLGRREGGGPAEVFLVRDLGGDRWQALLRPGKRLRAGASIAIDDELRVSVATGEGPLREVRLVARRGGVAEAGERCGRGPPPPDLQRPHPPE